MVRGWAVMQCTVGSGCSVWGCLKVAEEIGQRTKSGGDRAEETGFGDRAMESM